MDVQTVGRWITIEGIDGAGKLSLLKALDARLQEQGVQTTRLTRYLNPELVSLWKRLVAADAVDQRQAAALAAADAVVGYTRLIRPALDMGKWVLMDGFTFSHQVQFSLRGVPQSELDALFNHLPLPDRIIYLHTSVPEALERGLARGRLDPWTTGLDTTGMSIGEAWAQRASFSRSQMEAAFLSWQARAQAAFSQRLPTDRTILLRPPAQGTDQERPLVEALLSTLAPLLP